MRFRHLDPASVLSWLRSNPARIQLLEWESERRPGGLAALIQTRAPQPAGPAQPATINDIGFIAGRGEGPTHAGLVLRYYFHVNAGDVGNRPLSLVEAVRHVEKLGEPEEFLLAGHPEGGLISVSRTVLPFQAGLEPITWWGP